MATQTGSIDLTASNGVKLMAEAGFESVEENYYTKAELDVTVQGINTEVSKKVNGTEIISTINQSAESVSINASKINLTGAVTISDLASDAQNATLNSNISVGGRNLLPTSLVNANVQSGVTASGITIVLEEDGWFKVSGSKSGNSAIGLWSDSDYSTPAVPQLDNLSGKTLTWTVETEGTPFVAGSTYDTTTHIVAYKTSSSSSTRMGGFESLVKTATVNFTHYGEIRYYIGANVPEGTTVDGRFRIMVETGNVSTAWTPAPEDTPDQMTWYGTCSTEAASAAKTVVCDGFKLQTGARLVVKSTTANTTNAPMLNVNGTGGIATWYNNAVSSSSNPIRWGANATLNFVYDGSVWVLDERPPSYSATCSTAATTRSKAPSVVGALVVNGTRLSVRFSTANTYAANSVQINLSSTGAYSIYQDNAVTSTTNTLFWNANTLLTFVAQGTYWHLLTRSDASKTATSYVTEITGQNGIMVHPSTDQTTGVRITSDVDILRDGTSVINIGTDDAIRIGAADNVQMLIESDGLEIDNEVGDKVFGIESSSSGSTTVTAALVTWSAVADVDTTARTVSDATASAGDPIVTAEVNGTDYTLESTHVTTTVTAGTGVSVALTSDGVTYVRELMVIEVDEDGVETIAPCELSVEYQRAVTDVATLDFSGKQVIHGSGIGMLFTNDEWSSNNQVDTYFKAINEETAKSIAFGVGAGGYNRGIWDYAAGSWLIHRTANDDTVINGPKFSVAASGNVKSTYQVRVTGNGTNADGQKRIALRSNNVGNRGLYDESLNKWILFRSLAGNDHLGGGKWYVDDPYDTSTNFKLGDPQRIMGSGSYTAGTSDTMGPYVTLTAGKWLVTGNWIFSNTSSNSKRLVVGFYRSTTSQAYTYRVHTTASSSTNHRLEVVDTITIDAASERLTLYASSSPASTSAATQYIVAIRLT